MRLPCVGDARVQKPGDGGGWRHRPGGQAAGGRRDLHWVRRCCGAARHRWQGRLVCVQHRGPHQGAAVMAHLGAASIIAIDMSSHAIDNLISKQLNPCALSHRGRRAYKPHEQHWSTSLPQKIGHALSPDIHIESSAPAMVAISQKTRLSSACKASRASTKGSIVRNTQVLVLPKTNQRAVHQGLVNRQMEASAPAVNSQGWLGWNATPSTPS